jgi:2-methylisocitrate lyase-like PEP mutase family enzyme
MNLAAVKDIARVAKEYEKPLTVDIQDGYGAQLEEAFAGLIKLGASGANLEDFDNQHQKMYSEVDATSRVERALTIAREYGVQDFVLNARCDTLAHGGELSYALPSLKNNSRWSFWHSVGSFEEVISRGKAYLAVGATTVFVIPGPDRKIGKDDINQMIREFDGRLNIGWNPSSPLSIQELTKLGVARVSVGPGIQLRAMELVKKAAEHIMSGGAVSWVERCGRHGLDNMMCYRRQLSFMILASLQIRLLP